MIKQLKKYDIQTTPFIATKNWNLLNVQHQDLIILEQFSSSISPPTTSSIPDTYIALEFVDYTFDTQQGYLNIDCNVALEQQTFDPVVYEEGISGSGFFSINDPQNPNGTFKRLVYHQILRSFYNNYHNPLQMFGLESVDFQTSGMQRYLSSIFKIFTIPQNNFGDKIQPGSVTFIDNAFDDNYTVKDDSQGNLLATPNLFSRTQEVRSIPNSIVDEIWVYECPSAITTAPDMPAELSAIALDFSNAYVWWSSSYGAAGYYLYRSGNSGSLWEYLGATSLTGSYDTTLEQTSSYSYKVIAYNAYGMSPSSNTSSISTFASL